MRPAGCHHLPHKFKKSEFKTQMLPNVKSLPKQTQAAVIYESHFWPRMEWAIAHDSDPTTGWRHGGGGAKRSHTWGEGIYTHSQTSHIFAFMLHCHSRATFHCANMKTEKKIKQQRPCYGSTREANWQTVVARRKQTWEATDLSRQCVELQIFGWCGAIHYFMLLPISWL